MSDFDYLKYLRENKLKEEFEDEGLSLAQIEDIAQDVLIGFRKNDDLDLHYYITPGSLKITSRGGQFALDTEPGENTPGDDWKDENGFGIDNYLGRYAGGNFSITAEDEGYVVKNAAAKNAVVGYVSPEGEFDFVRDIEKSYDKLMEEDWGSSDQSAMNHSIHRDLGEPTSFPGLSKIMNAAADAVDFYWDDWDEYRTNPDDLVMQAASKYAYAYFPEFMAAAAKFMEPIDEARDMNDPVLLALRAKKMAQPQGSNPTIPNKFSDKLAALKKLRAEIMRDMEQEAELEGGPIADEYGDKLNKIDAEIAKLMKSTLQETQDSDVLAMVDMVMDALGAEKFIDELILAMDTDEAKANLKHIIRMHDLGGGMGDRKDMPGFEGTYDALDNLKIREKNNKKSNKMTTAELKEMIRQDILNELATDVNEDTDVDFGNSDVGLSKLYSDFYEEMETGKPMAETNTADIEKAIKSKKIDPRAVADAAKSAEKGDSSALALLMATASQLEEAEEEVTDDVEAKVKDLEGGAEDEVKNTEKVDIKVKEPIANEPTLTDDEKEIQGHLDQAMKLAQGLGQPNSEKLVQQIGNTITFFTRDFVVKENNMKEIDLPKNVALRFNQEIKNKADMAAVMLDLFDQLADNETLNFSADPMMARILKQLQVISKRDDSAPEGGEEMAETAEPAWMQNQRRQWDGKMDQDKDITGVREEEDLEEAKKLNKAEKKAHYKGAVKDDKDHIKALEKDKEADEKKLKNLNESIFPMWNKIK